MAVSQAVSLPLSPNEETVSHTVNAWKTWRVVDIGESREATCSFIDKYRQCNQMYPAEKKL